MVTLLNEICGLLKEGESFVLATILSHSGSTPRTSGAKMLIRAGGKIIGTIGGGLLEAQVIKRAPDLFDTGCTCVEHFALNADTTDSMDMICGGSLSVLLELVVADPDNRQMFDRLRTLAAGHGMGLVVTPIPGSQESGVPSEKCLIEPDGPNAGKKCSTIPNLSVLFSSYRHLRKPAVVIHEHRKYYIEPMAHQESLFLFGAGHVSQSVARLGHTVGFRTVVVDDRPEFANRKRFGEVDEILVPQHFDDAIESMTIDGDSYLVIVTRGHLHDRTVLAQALKTKAGYIGMIGSKRKRDAIYASLLTAGYTQSDFERVHSPIGLDIDAETPEEIAVSIVSELIAVRASRRKQSFVHIRSSVMAV